MVWGMVWHCVVHVALHFAWCCILPAFLVSMVWSVWCFVLYVMVNFIRNGVFCMVWYVRYGIGCMVCYWGCSIGGLVLGVWYYLACVVWCVLNGAFCYSIVLSVLCCLAWDVLYGRCCIKYVVWYVLYCM